MSDFGERDKRCSWHPFTQMQEWCAPDYDPVVLVGGDGAMLRDDRGREYVDGNSSIWTNIHGHNHPYLNAAISEQLERVAHTSFLGATNDRAIELAERLLKLFPGDGLERVFFSDNGSTAVEVALKMTIQYWQHCGKSEKRRFVAFHNAYHGDTMGASSLGGVGLFHDRFDDYQFPVARVGSMEELREQADTTELAAVVIEPLIQGVNQMHCWPRGMMAELRAWCDENDVLLIADEVMTGFGRTGKMFACEHENVVPDFVALAKGLTGGYMPMGATLVNGKVYDAFLGTYEEQKTFYYGHSYTGNPLGCAVALASLDLFGNENVLENLQPKIVWMEELLSGLKSHESVGDIRQCGFIAGIDVVGYPAEQRIGVQICEEAKKHGLLTRPILDTIVLMPPLCISREQLEAAVVAISKAIETVCVT